MLVHPRHTRKTSLQFRVWIVEVLGQLPAVMVPDSELARANGRRVHGRERNKLCLRLAVLGDDDLLAGGRLLDQRREVGFAS
jgi:hypothetical protein